MKLASRVCIGLFALAVLLGLAQLWLHFLSADLFIKLLITIAGIGALVFLPAFILKENKEAEKRAKGGGLD